MVLHGVEPVRQPDKRRNAGGDCFACATRAMLEHLYPEQSFDFDFIFKLYTTKSAGGSDCLMNTWYGYGEVLSRLKYGDSDFGIDGGFDIDFEKYIPTQRFDRFNHNSYAWYPPPSDYWMHVDAFLRAGYVLLVSVQLDGKGPATTKDGRPLKNSTDHVVLVDGARQYWPVKDQDSPWRGLKCEVHVVDSATRHETNEYWIGMDDFLWKHGAGGFWMVRRATRYDLEDMSGKHPL